MAAMQLLIPQLEDTDGIRSQQHQATTRHHEDRSSTAASLDQNHQQQQHQLKEDEDAETDGTSLPEQLRENFEDMKSLLRQSSRDALNQEEQVELRRKEREKATEIAVAVDEEVNRLRNGIAELEAMLAAAEENGPAANIPQVQHHRRRPAEVDVPGGAVIGFPELPAVVPIVHAESDEESLGNSSISSGWDVPPL